MKSIIALCFMMIAQVGLLRAQYNEKNLRLESKETSTSGFQNLQLYPVRASSEFLNEHRSIGKYITLKEALQKKKVEISELGKEASSGTVNTLFIENVSRDTIMILSGEVVQGGKQDRMIAQDFILYPNSGKKDVSVFCVEHGRWQVKEGGKAFDGYFTISSNDVRKAGTVAKNQQEVWNKVAETTEKNSAGTSTGTLTALKDSESYGSSLNGYVTYFGKQFINEPDVIGVIAVSGGNILGCDMFATHELFAKSYPNLLNSYATEAITSGSPVTVSYDKVNTYLRKIIDNENEQEEEVEKNGTMLKDGKRKIHISTF